MSATIEAVYIRPSKRDFAILMDLEIENRHVFNPVAVELTIHHDGYERVVRVDLPRTAWNHLKVRDVPIQHGTGIDFTDIEACFIEAGARDGGERSAPIFFELPNLELQLIPRRANSDDGYIVRRTGRSGH